MESKSAVVSLTSDGTSCNSVVRGRGAGVNQVC